MATSSPGDYPVEPLDQHAGFAFGGGDDSPEQVRGRRRIGQRHREQGLIHARDLGPVSVDDAEGIGGAVMPVALDMLFRQCQDGRSRRDRPRHDRRSVPPRAPRHGRQAVCRPSRNAWRPGSPAPPSAARATRISRRVISRVTDGRWNGLGGGRRIMARRRAEADSPRPGRYGSTRRPPHRSGAAAGGRHGLPARWASLRRRSHKAVLPAPRAGRPDRSGAAESPAGRFPAVAHRSGWPATAT